MMETSPFTSWLPFNRPSSGKKQVIFCFPYGGGNPIFFREWQQAMPDSVEVYPVQLPGRGMRIQEPSYQELDPLVEQIAKVILPILQTAHSFSFFGHSMGALLGYRLSLYLQDQLSFPPHHLFVSGFRAPHLPSHKSPIHQLPDPQFADRVVELGGMPEELIKNPDYLQLFLPAIRADFTICETYTLPENRVLHTPITVFGGLDDPETSEEQLTAWQEVASQPIQLNLLEGNHFFIHSQQSTLIDTIQRNLSLKPFQK